MSSPDEGRDIAPDERKLTIIVVPHGDLETRNFMISYGRLKLIVVSVLVLLFALAVGLATLIPIMAQAARVPGLVRELEALEGERARVAQLARTIQQMEEQYERVREMLGANAVMAGDSAPVLPPLRRDSGSTEERPLDDSESLVSLWPLATSGFITRVLAEGGSRHPGVDIAVPRNSYIRAAGAGVVRVAGLDDIYGRYVILEHGEQMETVYGHASRIFVTAGDRVRRGEVLGLTGSTGRSTAPHLHFEVRLAGRPVDPLDYVRQP